jgi:hypothetical protein
MKITNDDAKVQLFLMQLLPGDCFTVKTREDMHFMRLFIDILTNYSAVCLETGKLFTFSLNTEVTKIDMEGVVK